MQIPEKIKEKLKKIAEARGKDYDLILQEYKQACESVKDFKDLSEEHRPYAAFRHLLGKLSISEQTQVLMPPPVR